MDACFDRAHGAAEQPQSHEHSCSLQQAAWKKPFIWAALREEAAIRVWAAEAS